MKRDFSPLATAPHNAMPADRPLRKVLVTGGAGFVGSTLLRRLVGRAGTSVLNYDALTYAGLRESVEALASRPQYEFVHGNVTDHEAFTAAVTGFQPDTLIHLAAESHVDRSIAEPQAFVRTNVEGTATVLRVWRDYLQRGVHDAAPLLVHVSTDEVYGSLAAGAAAREGDRYSPSSPYSATKAAADHLVEAYRRTYGLPSIIACPTNNYGPRQFPEKLIPLATLRAMRAEPIPLYGDGLQVRDWLNVEDCAEGLILIAARGRTGETYHLGAAAPGDEEWSNCRVVETICDAVDELRPTGESRRRLIQRVADRPGHDRRYALDSSKIRDELGWCPNRSFAVGLRETVRWYLENPEWVAVADERT